ncbi:cyclic GMP-AMP synthase [Anguilla rostrata]|uniref:cyclic GMP-AMP synthase n=1 Tax=Anguilla rostrata TaxID=7938 RepID=UPI0030CD3F95
MTGRGRTGDGKSKREKANPGQSSSCSKGQGNHSPPGAKAKSNSEQRSSNPRCASGIARISNATKKCPPTSGAVESNSCGSPPLKFNGDVKPKRQREPAQTTSVPICKDTAKAKETSTTASRGASNPEPKFGTKDTKSPSLDRPASRLEKKTVTSPAKNDTSANKVLRSTLDKLKIKMTAKSDSSGIINDIVETIVKHMKEKSECFRAVAKVPTGSYYENVKISKPDEFDVMLAVRADRVILQEFDSEGAFYSVALKRTPREDPLRCFLQKDNTISASEMLSEFREHVKKAVESFPDVKVERKKAGCPAVTLLIKQKDMEIGLDIVLSLEVHSSWPEFTTGGLKIETWLGTKVKRNFKGRPFYLVPKYAGKGNEERDGVCAKDAWRISFSHVEKDILTNHGQAKTCCEATGTKCCRKPCLKLLKHLLHQLKEKHPKQLSRFFSYLCKTTLLHACASRVCDSDWPMDRLNDCFQQLLEDFQGHLRRAHLPNFFIPTQNLLGSAFDRKSLEFLVNCIESERSSEFPIFTQ